MTTPYTPLCSNVTGLQRPNINVPVDGDLDQAAIYSPELQTLADYEEYLLNQLWVGQVSTWQGFSFSGGAFVPSSLCAGYAAGLSNTVALVATMLDTSNQIYTQSILGSGAWTARTANVGTAGLKYVAFNGSLFVAVGLTNGTTAAITTSSDGVTWTLRTTGVPGSSSSLNKVIWVSSLSLWVAVGASGLILTSPDGITWTSRTGAGSTTLTNVAFGNGTLIAGNSTALYTSTDAVTWTSQTNPSIALNAPDAVVYNSALGLWLTEAANHTAFKSSTDGITWTSRTAPTTTNARNLFLAVGRLTVAVEATSNIVWTTLDGLTWTPRYPVYSGQVPSGALSFGTKAPNGSLVALDSNTPNNRIFYSCPIITP